MYTVERSTRSGAATRRLEDGDHVVDHLARLGLEAGELRVGLHGHERQLAYDVHQAAVHDRLGIVDARGRRARSGVLIARMASSPCRK